MNRPAPAPTETAGDSNGWDAFQAAEIRVGTIREALPFPEARVPAIKLRIDLGPAGERWSSAQITDHYSPQDLAGRQVLALINVPAKRIAGFKSECLTLGLAAGDGSVLLVTPDTAISGTTVPDGARLY